MAGPRTQIIAFDRFEVDPARGELRRDGAPVACEPQVLDLIAHLAAHPGQIVSRDDLIEHVWGGRIVSDSAIASRINAARAALGDDGTAQRVIKTIPRRGFRFEAAPAPQAATPAAPPLPDKPSIAVLPFQNMSGDPEQAYFSDGITDDIIIDLARYDELFVTARHSSFAYRDTGMPPVEIARALGVQYLAEGAVRRAGSRIRVTARLYDPRAGRDLWSERFDRDLTDIFAVQDEIAAIIVNTLAGQIARQFFRRHSASGAQALDAYDHVLRAYHLVQRFAPEDHRAARELAEKAVAIDPEFAWAHALIAWTHDIEAALRWVPDLAEAYERAYAAAVRAVQLDPDSAWGHAALGFADIWGSRNPSRGLLAMERAVALSPNNATFRGWYSQGLCFVGRPEDALAEIELALRLNPHHPPVYTHFLARVLFTLGRMEEALDEIEKVVTAMPANTNGHLVAAACYAAFDRPGDASAAVAAARAVSPGIGLANIHYSTPYQRPQDMARYLDLLRQAGLPE